MVLVNGKPAQSIDYSDRGLNYGDGIFETMVAIDDEIRFYSSHLERLRLGCDRLGLPMPDLNQLQNEINILLSSSTSSPHVIKLLLTRGTGGRGYSIPEKVEATRILSRHDYPDKVMSFWQSGMSLHICQQRLALNPTLAGIKHLNRLEQVLASAERSGLTYDDGLMLSSADNIVEGTMSNVFWISDNVYYTPDLKDCGIEGVIRSKVIQLLKSTNRVVKIGNYTVDDLLKADTVFLTNSSMLVAQVTNINETNWPLVDEIGQLRMSVAEMT